LGEGHRELNTLYVSAIEIKAADLRWVRKRAVGYGCTLYRMLGKESLSRGEKWKRLNVEGRTRGRIIKD